MNRPVLIIEMPDLNYEQAAHIELFLRELVNAFENHYARQLSEYYRELEHEDNINIDDVIDGLF
jgi:hypothetical protein